MKSPRRMTLAFLVLAGAALSSLTFGCAGVKGQTPPGNNGTGGTMVTPAIPGLVSIQVSPGTQTVALTASGATLSPATATFTATGTFMDGHTEDVSTRVGWPSQFSSLRIASGVATVNAPGTFAITATSGSLVGMATLVASFTGNRYATDFDPAQATTLDGAATVSSNIAYPLDGAIIPPNLSPVQVHIARTATGQSLARINFSSGDAINVNYYANCQPGVGSGCYVDLPLEITQLFIAASDKDDIKLTARTGGQGSPLIESTSVKVAWANVPLSGGLYYWTTMADGVVSGYISPRNTDGTASAGTGIQRYDFGQDGAAKPQLVYTDKGAPPTFLGSPPADSSGGQCIGCHAITNDGKTMALTIGGSDYTTGSNFALLNLTTLTMVTLDATVSAGVTSTTDINYYKQFRRKGVATETTFGPNGDVMVNMFASQLLLHGTTATLANEGPVVPSWTENKTDPFWSQSGKVFVFTSFAQPDVGTYNTAGLNGDMKRGGQIAITTAGATSIDDAAHVLVPREANITKYYPSVSNDDQLIVYNQSTCSFDPDLYTNLAVTPQVGVYGSQTCDGYDDSSASLWMTSPTGAQPVKLTVANGASATNDNSWPRWSPDNGTFRGQKLYWLAFSSRRPYGFQVNTGTPATTKPQLWFSAVVVGGELFGDPSHAPVWLPNQNPTVNGALPNQVPTGNHVPQWVKVAVPIPG
jgi:hypothetical protein